MFEELAAVPSVMKGVDLPESSESLWTVDSNDSETIELFATLRGIAGRRCATSGRVVCAPCSVLSVALGYSTSPACLATLADRLAREPEALVAHVEQYMTRHPCFAAAWARAHGGDASPTFAPADACREAFDPTDFGAAGTGASARSSSPGPGESDADPVHTEAWDAGDMGCGDLVLQLRIRMRALAPGAVMRVEATDPGAPEDIPAWCGLTGHRLVGARAPYYWIERKEE